MTRPYDLRRIRRLLLLLPAAAKAARSGKGLPLSRAVELTGARSEKEIIADVEALSELWAAPGEVEDVIAVDIEDGEVYVTYASGFGRPPAFSLAEGAVLLAALAPFEEGGGRPVKEAARKLRKAIPEVLRAEADRLVGGLDLQLDTAGPWAGALREAIATRVETTIEYRSVGGGVAAKRVVEPRLVFHREGHWYLAAWHVAKGGEHLFRLDRIVSVELGTRIFGEHQGPPVARYGKSLYFQSGAEREVTVRYRDTAATLAGERFGARAKANDDGSVSVTTKVTPGNFLLGVVLGYGGEATIEAPEDVVAQLRERVEALQRLYA